MGIIQRQSVQSTFVITAGFAIGAFNMLVLAPRLLTAEQLGLTRILLDAATTLATLCTLGCTPIIYKFFPFYKSYLPAKQNDLPFFSLIICSIGFVIMCLAGYAARDIIVRKFSERSPLFVDYSYLVYPLTFFLLASVWLEGFVWSFKKGVYSNALKETTPRLLFTIILVLFTYHLVSIHQFLWIFSFSYVLPAVAMFLILRRTGEFFFISRPSSVTMRLKGRMINFGLFLFGAQFLNLLSRTVDTFFIAVKAERGLIDTAVFTIATYVVTLMEVPQRSMNAITVPVLAEAWKNKDLKQINNIYTKSVSNLMIIGLIMFSLILLNARDLARFLGKDYTGIEYVIFFLGLGKLIDLGTGANAQVISTSNYWKVDFTTNVIYTLLALPLNYILISHYGLIGAAWSTLISLTLYNLMRFGFLWYKFGLQPYTSKDLLAVGIALVGIAAAHYFPHTGNLYIDIPLRTMVFCIIFAPLVYRLRLSVELNQMADKFLPWSRKR